MSVELKAVTCDEIVEAINTFVNCKIVIHEDTLRDNPTHMHIYDALETSKRTIIDGLRFHSASRGVVGGGTEHD